MKSMHIQLRFVCHLHSKIMSLLNNSTSNGLNKMQILCLIGIKMLITKWSPLPDKRFFTLNYEHIEIQIHCSMVLLYT